MNISSSQEWSFGSEYVLGLIPSSQGIVVTLSDSSIHIIPKQSSSSIKYITNAHKNSSITGVKSVDGNSDSNVIATSGQDGVKLWDLRNESKNPIWSAQPLNKSAITSIDINSTTNPNKIAVGTELTGSDAGVFIWDYRFNTAPIISYTDSHNDDITDIKFHPLNSKILISGSTDGYINIYDTSINEEEDALFQTINHSSIHSCGFTSNKRIYALSHIETLSIYELNDNDFGKEEDLEVITPIEFGDLRPLLNCDYTIDLIPNYIAIGNNNNDNNNNNCRLVSFETNETNNETIETNKTISLIGGHGEEVIRSIYKNKNGKEIFTGGEDGIVKIWNIDNEVKHKHKNKNKKNKSKKSGHGVRYKPY